MVVRGDRSLEERVTPLLYRLTAGGAVDAFRGALAEADREVRDVGVLGGGPTPSVEALGTTVDVVVAPRGDRPSAVESRAVLGQPGGLPLADGSLDAVVVPALHAVGSLEGLFGEAARALRPGGVLAVRSVDPATLQGRGLRAVQYLLGRETTLLTPDEALARGDGAGLDGRVTESGWRYTVAAVAPRGSARP